jgi:phosphoglucosamine mutase
MLVLNVVTTTVGDRYVLEDMITNDFSLGGEQSGHFDYARISRTQAMES